MASRAPAGFAWTMQSFGDDVVAVLDVLDLQDAVLVGHSMGGDVVVEAARQRPERILGMVWVDTYRELAAPTESAADDEAEKETAPSWLVSGPTSPASPRISSAGCSADADPALVERVAPTWHQRRRTSRSTRWPIPSSTKEPLVAAFHEAGVPLVAVNPESRRPTRRRWPVTGRLGARAPGRALPDARGPRPFQPGARRGCRGSSVEARPPGPSDRQRPRRRSTLA